MLTSEEGAAFPAFLEDLRLLLVRARRSEVFGDADRHELSWMLAADLDPAYQRLRSAA